jgi:hypothetical protein
VAAVLDRIGPVLDAARTTGARLLRVSFRSPPWAIGSIRDAARVFCAQLEAFGAAGALLSLDVSQAGEPHLYGYVLSDDREAVIAAWLAASGADRKATEVRAVTGWASFATTGEPNASAGKRGTFRENLARSVSYAFKPWPTAYGSRDLARDLVARGVFAPLMAEVLADLSAGASRP